MKLTDEQATALDRELRASYRRRLYRSLLGGS
jgi:hypothetical protein